MAREDVAHMYDYRSGDVRSLEDREWMAHLEKVMEENSLEQDADLKLSVRVTESGTYGVVVEVWDLCADEGKGAIDEVLPVYVWPECGTKYSKAFRFLHESGRPRGDEGERLQELFDDYILCSALSCEYCNYYAEKHHCEMDNCGHLYWAEKYIDDMERFKEQIVPAAREYCEAFERNHPFARDQQLAEQAAVLDVSEETLAGTAVEVKPEDARVWIRPDKFQKGYSGVLVSLKDGYFAHIPEDSYNVVEASGKYEGWLVVKGSDESMFRVCDKDRVPTDFKISLEDIRAQCGRKPSRQGNGKERAAEQDNSK